MAIKPPPFSDVARQLSNLLGDNSGIKGEVDRTMRGLVQSGLAKMDMVSRDEFDAQTEVLARTRARVEELERQLEALLQRQSQSQE